MKVDAICPVCDVGVPVVHSWTTLTDYKGQSAPLILHAQKCPACGSVSSTEDSVRINARARRAFERKIDGLMSAGEIRSIREYFSLSQSVAARLFGGGPMAFSKYENDEVCQSEAMDSLLWITRNVPGVLEILAAHRGIQLPTPNNHAKSARSPSIHWEHFTINVSEYSPAFVAACDVPDLNLDVFEASHLESLKVDCVGGTVWPSGMPATNDDCRVSLSYPLAELSA